MGCVCAGVGVFVGHRNIHDYTTELGRPWSRHSVFCVLWKYLFIVEQQLVTRAIMPRPHQCVCVLCSLNTRASNEPLARIEVFQSHAYKCSYN